MRSFRREEVAIASVSFTDGVCVAEITPNDSPEAQKVFAGIDIEEMEKALSARLPTFSKIKEGHPRAEEMSIVNIVIADFVISAFADHAKENGVISPVATSRVEDILSAALGGGADDPGLLYRFYANEVAHERFDRISHDVSSILDYSDPFTFSQKELGAYIEHGEVPSWVPVGNADDLGGVFYESAANRLRTEGLKLSGRAADIEKDIGFFSAPDIYQALQERLPDLAAHNNRLLASTPLNGYVSFFPAASPHSSDPVRGGVIHEALFSWKDDGVPRAFLYEELSPTALDILSLIGVDEARYKEIADTRLPEWEKVDGPVGEILFQDATLGGNTLTGYNELVVLVSLPADDLRSINEGGSVTFSDGTRVGLFDSVNGISIGDFVPLENSVEVDLSRHPARASLIDISEGRYAPGQRAILPDHYFSRFVEIKKAESADLGESADPSRDIGRERMPGI
jgi:hypothetical protein